MSFVSDDEVSVQLPEHVRGYLSRPRISRNLNIGEKVSVVIASLFVDEGRLYLDLAQQKLGSSTEKMPTWSPCNKDHSMTPLPAGKALDAFFLETQAKFSTWPRFSTASTAARMQLGLRPIRVCNASPGPWMYFAPPVPIGPRRAENVLAGL